MQVRVVQVCSAQIGSPQIMAPEILAGKSLTGQIGASHAGRGCVRMCHEALLDSGSPYMVAKEVR